MADNIITKSEDGMTIKVVSPKTEKALLIYKPEDGYKFYAVRYENGAQVPQELSGRWTGSAAALKSVLLHLEHKKTTKRKEVNDRADKRTAEKGKLNASKSDTENG